MSKVQPELPGKVKENEVRDALGSTVAHLSLSSSSLGNPWAAAHSRVLIAKSFAGATEEIVEKLTKPLAKALLDIRADVLQFSRRVATVGPNIDMKSFYDAATADDGKIYLIPQNSTRVVTIDISTGRMLPYGRDLGDTSNKFSAAILGKDRCIYGIPASFNRVLKIDPMAVARNEKTFDVQVGGSDNAVKHFRTESESSKVTFVGKDLSDNAYKWQQACLDKISGIIYAAPYNADGILIIDPSHETMKKETAELSVGRSGKKNNSMIEFDEKASVNTLPYLLEGNNHFHENSNMYFGCVYDETNQRVIFVPSNATHFLAYEPKTRQFSFLATKCTNWASVKFKGTKLSRALYHKGKVYCASCSLNRIAVLDIKNDQVYFVGPNLGPEDYKYCDVRKGADGNIWFIPGSKGKILVVSPSNEGREDLREVGEDFQAKGSFNAAVLASCGPENFMSGSMQQHLRRTFLYLIPCRASRIIRVNTDISLNPFRPAFVEFDIENFYSTQMIRRQMSRVSSRFSYRKEGEDMRKSRREDPMFQLWIRSPRTIVHGLFHDFFFHDLVDWIGSNIERCAWSFGSKELEEVENSIRNESISTKKGAELETKRIHQSLRERQKKWLSLIASSECLGRISSIEHHEVRKLLLSVSLRGEVIGPLRKSLKGVMEVRYSNLSLKQWCGCARAKDGRIFFLPLRETRALVLDPSNGEVDYVDCTSNSETQFQYIGYNAALYTTAILGKDRCIYGVPGDALHLLRIKPGYDGAKNESELFPLPKYSEDETMVNAAAQSQSRTHDNEKKWKWMGSCTTNDGSIFCAPYGTNQILKIETGRYLDLSTVAEVLDIEYMDEQIEKHSAQSMSTRISMTNLDIPTFGLYSNKVRRQARTLKELHSEIQRADERFQPVFSHGTITGYWVPHEVPIMKLIEIQQGLLETDDHYISCVYSERKGAVYFIPANARSILKYDLNATSEEQEQIPMENPNSAHKDHESPHYASNFASLPYKFTGGVLVVDEKNTEKIICSPCHANTVLIFETETEESYWATWNASEAQQIGKRDTDIFEVDDYTDVTEWRYSGIIQSTGGDVFVIPGNVGQALRIDPTTNNVSMLGEPLPSTTGRVYIGQGAESLDRFLYCSSRNRDHLMRIDTSDRHELKKKESNISTGSIKDVKIMNESSEDKDEMASFWRDRPTLFFVALTHAIFRQEFLEWLKNQSNVDTLELARSCGKGLDWQREDLNSVEKLSRRLASIPDIVWHLLTIEDESLRDFLYTVPLVRKTLVDPRTVGPWLARLLKDERTCEAALGYLEKVSKIEGFTSLIQPMSTRLPNLFPTIMRLELELKERAARTTIILGIMDAKLTERPLAVAFVTLDLSLVASLMVLYCVTADRIASSLSQNANDISLVVGLALSTSLCLIQDIVLQRALHTSSKNAISQYLKNPWNLFNPLAAISGYTVCFFAILDEGYRTGMTSRIYMSLGCIFIFLKVLSKIRGLSQDMATVISTLNYVLIALVQFGFVLLGLMIVFAFIFYLLLGHPSIQIGREDAFADDDSDDPFGTPGESILTLLRMTMGDFDRGWFRSEYPDLNHFVIFLYAMFTLVGVIIMLNVLIAVVSEVYTDAKEKAVVNYFVGTLDLVAALDIMGVTSTMVHFGRFDAHIRYIIGLIPRRSQQKLHHATPEERHRMERSEDIKKNLDIHRKLLLEEFHDGFEKKVLSAVNKKYELIDEKMDHINRLLSIKR